jgi:1,4-dihydroxy-2-naphthoate octaprenyltransferase
MNLKTWFLETRPSFLLLTPIAFSVGLASAYLEGSFHAPRALLGLIGVLLAHISINTINDYFDYKSGLDFKTKPTPFSGGSGLLPSGTLEAKDVYRFALGSLIVGSIIGVYFVLTTGWMLLPLIAVAAISIYFYTPGFSRWYVGEIITGLNFGPLMVLGGYFIMTGHYGAKPLSASIIPGILVGTLLFLNEFPDVEADNAVGRRNVVISLGLAQSSKIYSVLIASTYLWVFASIILGLMPPTTLVTYLTLPLALKAVKGVLRDHDNVGRLIPAMGANVMLVLSMTAMTTIGLLLSVFFR